MHPKALLDICTQLVARALEFGHAADALLARLLRAQPGAGPRERAVLAATVYAVLRKKLLFEYLAQAGPGPQARRLAILGFAGARAWLAPALSAAEQQWLAGCDAVDPDSLPAAQRHNLPPWLAQALEAQLGAAAFWPLAHSLLQGAPLDLRVNTLKARREQVQQELAACGIESRPTPFSPWGLRVSGKPALARLAVFARGAIEVQDEGAQLLALLLDARRDELVLDFCAGAGGKTLALGACMRNTGRLYACDVAAHRLAAMRPRLARSGLTNVHSAALAHERDARLQPLLGRMDRVLVDVPCSGLGSLRRNPDLKWRQSAAAVQQLAARQGAILTSAARLLKPGGRLVYASCSLLEQENEAVAQAFGAAQPDFAPLAAGALLAQRKVADAERLCSGGASGNAWLRLWPHLHQTDGFFAAVWVRK